MSLQSNIGVFGLDMRQVYVTKALLNRGYSVCTFQLAELIEDENCTRMQTLEDIFSQCRVIIGPIPFAKKVSATGADDGAPTAIEVVKLLRPGQCIIGGAIPLALTEICADKNIFCYDLMKNEKIAILNAVATAEGSLMEAIAASTINLHGSRALVIGYGRCGKVLANKLLGLSAKVTVADKNAQALAWAQAMGIKTVEMTCLKALLGTFDYIFNTAPALVLDKHSLDFINPEATVIDIASLPGGVDFEYARLKGINARLCQGLPGKVAPKISAEILVNEIIPLLKERCD